ncbi:hypothetical protein ONZ45_g14330 [Pleurotus djamor]|nr:hypothetical protein ONZ45_g14330 [Pleurotus djamor]
MGSSTTTHNDLSKFTEKHLNRSNDNGLQALNQNVDVLMAVDAIRRAKRTSSQLCVNLINSVLHSVHAAFAPREKELICLDLGGQQLRHHPFPKLSSDIDFAVVTKPISDALSGEKVSPAYHHLISAGKRQRASNRAKSPIQHIAYLGIAGLALPHCVSLLGFFILKSGYTLHWSNPSGVEYSEEFTWDNLIPLLEYAYTLYIPPKDKLHMFYDNTITLSPDLPLKDAPRWDVEVGEVVYRRCEVKAVGQPWDRMSWISKSEDGFIIKDQHRCDDYTFTEGELYDTLHKAGYALGFADMVSYTPVKSHGKLIQTSANNRSRTKIRIVLATSGDPIQQCKTLVSFLRVMYDVLEAHRHAVNQKILHRDISMGNILINPRNIRPRAKAYQGHDRPRFIGEVLDGAPNADPESLIIDLDNASKIGEKREGHHDPLPDAIFAKGTPTYIARSVSQGRILEVTGFDPMPELPEDLDRRYQEAYEDANDPLRAFKDTEDTTHGGQTNRIQFKHYRKNHEDCETDFRHHPRHDAESVFWCILVFLLRVLPRDRSDEEDINERRFMRKWIYLRDHQIVDMDEQSDSRTWLLDGLNWSSSLHHKLAFVRPLLDELLWQVRPEYALLEPPPPQFHLHEAMQRILLKYIVQWKDQDVEFDTEMQRRCIEDDVASSQGSTASTSSSESQLSCIITETTPAPGKRKAEVAGLEDRPPVTESETSGDAPSVLVKRFKHVRRG